MNFASDFDVFVIIGKWNKNIFSPEWVSKFLLPETKLETEIPIMNLDASMRISSENIRIAVMGEKLLLTARDNKEETLQLIEDIGMKIADYLPHTPVRAFGVNLVFQCARDEFAEDIFSLRDNEALQSHGAHISGIIIKREMGFAGKTVNLNLNSGAAGTVIEINFHFEITNLADFKGKLCDNSIVNLKAEALTLLSDVYHLNLTPAGGA